MPDYPYLPPGRTFEFVSATHPAMRLAEAYARRWSLDLKQKVACVLIEGGAVIGFGANGSDYHEKHGCKRKELGCKSGEGYDLCDGCHPRNHAEISAIRAAIEWGNGGRLAGATLCMWGHWWCCEPCWDAMTRVGIAQVVLLEESARLFDMRSPDYVF